MILTNLCKFFACDFSWELKLTLFVRGDGLVEYHAVDRLIELLLDMIVAGKLANDSKGNR